MVRMMVMVIMLVRMMVMVIVTVRMMAAIVIRLLWCRLPHLGTLCSAA